MAIMLFLPERQDRQGSKWLGRDGSHCTEPHTMTKSEQCSVLSCLVCLNYHLSYLLGSNWPGSDSTGAVAGAIIPLPTMPDVCEGTTCIPRKLSCKRGMNRGSFWGTNFLPLAKSFSYLNHICLLWTLLPDVTYFSYLGRKMLPLLQKECMALHNKWRTYDHIKVSLWMPCLQIT